MSLLAQVHHCDHYSANFAYLIVKYVVLENSIHYYQIIKIKVSSPKNSCSIKPKDDFIANRVLKITNKQNPQVGVIVAC